MVTPDGVQYLDLPKLNGKRHALRIYNRPLRPSEAMGICNSSKGTVMPARRESMSLSGQNKEGEPFAIHGF
jgi:hypothetical protein